MKLEKHEQVLVVVTDMDKVSLVCRLALGEILMQLGFYAVLLNEKDQPKAFQVFKLTESPEAPPELLEKVKAHIQIENQRMQSELKDYRESIGVM